MGKDAALVFDNLIEEIENSINELNREGARAFQNKNLATANQLAQKGVIKNKKRNRLKHG